MADSIFDLVAEKLEECTALEKLEARGTVRIALSEAGLDARSVTRHQMAVMLERKRLLKHRDTLREEPDKEILVYEHAGSGEVFTLTDPHLRLDQLEEVQQRVAALLDPQGPEPAATEPSAAVAAEEAESGAPDRA